MRRALAVACATLAVLTPTLASAADPGSRFRPAATGQLGVVATESPAAARVGRAVLERGGNAIDAAAATVFAIGVARPQSCGIGGGGFLVYRSRTGRTASLDFRETAPGAFTPTTLAGEGLHTDFTGHLTVGVPGTVAGMRAALRRHGTISLRRALRPAERLARRGFRVPASLSAAMADNAERLSLFPAARAQYLRPDGSPYPAGARLRQPQYAASLRRIMRRGARAFYRGTIARRIVRDMRADRPTGDPGVMTLRDLRRYRPVWRPTVQGTYRDHRIIGMGPPTSGGIAVIEMLNVLQVFDLAGYGGGSANTLHLLAEAQKIAFADRARYVADPGFVPVPTDSLISARYAGARSQEIDLTRAKAYEPGLEEPATRPEESTTHVSVIDRRGNAVAVTCTIEQEFGSAVVAPGTGFLLNNELTDFGAAGTANEARPGKRPRSSMSPTIVVAPGNRPTLVLGGAGGARIIMGVLQAIVQHVDFDQPVDQALDAPRIEAGGSSLLVEDRRIAPAVLDDLRGRGHTITGEGEYAERPRVNAAGIVPVQPGFAPERTDGRVAAADPRTDDGALAQRPRRGSG